ncbi:hypothetical protein DI487_00185 [Flavobacterium sediminis]|uniref:Lipoprotein n=1 Tax=Flavobacterium sediminis TaxID=2201181 RepID=A0A2U8QQV9_9FLAO|nr:hypothetical protein [Flavobacterium sediminis]AWM12450.1 hypothetical protein DI487_00185 [Flavobacterium sediminis]
MKNFVVKTSIALAVISSAITVSSCTADDYDFETKKVNQIYAKEGDQTEVDPEKVKPPTAVKIVSTYKLKSIPIYKIQKEKAPQNAGLFG